MPFDSEPEMTEETGNEHEVKAPTAPGATTEEFAKGRMGDRIAGIHHASEVAP
jgi:hypothetical protein